MSHDMIHKSRLHAPQSISILYTAVTLFTLVSDYCSELQPYRPTG